MNGAEVNTLSSVSDGLADAAESVGRRVVAVGARRRGYASGIEWRPGIIVTADHVIEREAAKIIAPDGSKHEAAIAGRDPSTDIAILKVDGWTSGQLDDGRPEPRPGLLTLAVARPGEDGLSVSFGVVSAVGPEFRTHAGGKIDRYIRPDVTLYPGFSGGPLVTFDGAILGMNTSGLAHGMPLAIPASTLDRVVSQLLESGQVSRGYLGLRMQSVDLGAAVAQQHKLAGSHGLLVVGVEADGPAAKSGLLVGDVVIALNGQAVAESDAVQMHLDPETIGKTISVQIVRGGELKEVTVTVEKRPNRRHSHG